ncbi:MAG: hypothetical protein HY040_23815 [Planctomycetes bacterium]|nr:hypothetical protein [Planctomycetota bacterium]
MWRRIVLASLILLAPATVWTQNAQAQTVSERLLPADSQIYLRWDGVDAHRADFEKSALGKMLKEGTGAFLSSIWNYGVEALEKTVADKDPNAAKAITYLKEIPGVLHGIARNGVVFAVEVKSINPPNAEAYLIFTGSAGEKGTLLPFVNKITAMAGAPVQQAKVGNRNISHLGNGPVRVGWWDEAGKDVVVVFGTEDPEAMARAMDERKDHLAGSTRFEKLKAFKEFPTWARGYVDIPGLLKVGATVAPGAGQLLEDLGLKSLGSVTFHSGFDGPAERSILEIDIPGERKGLLALMSKKTIKLTDLPPLPADVTSFSASNFNLGSLYDAGIQVAEAVINMLAPGQGGNLKERIKEFEQGFGINLTDDFFGNFGDMYVSYSSSSEGFLTMGGIYAFKVKDEKKIVGAVESIINAIKNFPGANFDLQKTKYHGGEIMELKLKADFGDMPVLTLAAHKGWLLLSNLPQPIQGFILRSNGELPAWKASDEVTKALAGFPMDFTSIAISDPRPSVKLLLSLAPSAMSIANSVLPQLVPGFRPFDASAVPHAEFAVRHLFPNVTVTTDTGKKIRIETRASLALPF